MAKEYENLKKLWDTRFTPLNDDVVELMHLVKAEYGGTWKRLAIAVGIKPRHLRRIYNKHDKTVSLRVMDQILGRSDYSYRLHLLPWYTVDQLVAKGIWGIPLPNARKPERYVPIDSDFPGELPADEL